MLTENERKALAKNTLSTDYPKAAERYTTLTGVPISAKYIGKVIRGECNQGRRRYKHDLASIVLATTEVVKERRLAMSRAAAQLQST